MPRAVRSGLALLLLIAVSRSVTAQDRDRQCQAIDWSVGQADIPWVEMPLNSRNDPDSVGRARVRDRLVGEYLLLQVTTEGSGDSKWVSESALRIFPWPVYDTVRQFGKIGRILAYGRARTLRAGYLPDSVRASPSGRDRFYRITFEPPGRLSLFAVGDSVHLEAMIMDAGGPNLDVLELEPDEFRGRWQDTGIAVMAGQTPVGYLLETRRGYFCAWRVR